MDAPARRMGPKHRRLRHVDTDPASLLQAMLLFGPEAPAAMVIHTVRDRMQSEFEQILRKLVINLFK